MVCYGFFIASLQLQIEAISYFVSMSPAHSVILCSHKDF
jgi:hypothetical protein